MRNRCPICNSHATPVINLPQLPLTEVYLPHRSKGEAFDQELRVCDKCGHGFLYNILNKNALYNDQYSFKSSKGTQDDAFGKFVKKITKGKRFKHSVEAGSNDKPTVVSAITRIRLDPVFNAFVEDVDFEPYKSKDNVVIMDHTIEHLVDPKAVIAKLIKELGENTLFLMQFPDFNSLVRRYNFQQIFHHHLHYFSLHSFTYMLKQLGCRVVTFSSNHNYWGSWMVAFKREKGCMLDDSICPSYIKQHYAYFRESMKLANIHTKECRKPLYAYGASSQLPLVGYHMRNDFSRLAGIYDDNIYKARLYFPNIHVPIKHTGRLKSLKGKSVIITALNYTDKIIAKLETFKPEEIVTPI